MWKRKGSSLRRLARIRFASYSSKHPKRVLGIMAVILFITVSWQVTSRIAFRNDYMETADKTYADLQAQHKPVGVESFQKPVSPAADMLELLQIYSQAQTINPDNISKQDSVFLKAIDKRLNRMIIHEKD